MPAPIRVAIVGGGCGGVAAAFWLTAPELGGRFDVTIYSQGWRLGGKGASGRAVDSDHRIEEHGLHLWLGCYHRAFQMMRLCYAEQASSKTLRTLSDAFIPMRRLTLGAAGSDTEGRQGSQWRISLPVTDDFPGDGPPSILGCLWDRLRGLARPFSPRSGSKCSGPPTQASPTCRLSQAGILLDLAAAFARGLLADVGFGRKDFAARIAALEAEDFRAWLARHGAGPAARESELVRSIYDLAFAYPAGDCERPGELAAGSTIGLILELFRYRGAPLFKMSSSMGDTIFAPLFRVLVQRGVKVAFFHRLRSVATDVGESRVTALRIDRQAKLARAAYAPLIEVAGAECWPSQPLWTQLEDGAALQARGALFEDSRHPEVVETIELTDGRDFDLVVLGVPPEILKSTTVGLRHPRWTKMLDNSASVATQSCQVWMAATTEDLGLDSSGLASALAPQLSTWADLSHLLDSETWDGPDPPRSVHYLCGPLAEAAAASTRPEDTVEAGLIAWLRGGSDQVREQARREPGNRVVRSLARANVDGSERYVQIPPGSIGHRLPPDALLYENLFLAGDWTRTRYCGGCVENAVQSGLSVARAISGRADLGGEGSRWP